MQNQILKLGSDVWWKSNGELNYGILRQKARETKEYELSDRIQTALVHSGSIKKAKLKKNDLRNNKDISVQDLVKYAGIGQIDLILTAREIFDGIYGDVSQQLVTYQELNDNKRAKHIRDNILNYLRENTMPAINYNDTIDFDEARKDNDKLAARIAVLTGAKRLIILGNYDGFCEDANNPKSLIERVDSITSKHYAMCGDTSENGTGGFKTKIEAAEIATQNGIEVIIGNVNYNLQDLINGNVRRTYFPPQR